MEEYKAFCEKFYLNINDAKSLNAFYRMKRLKAQHQRELETIKIRGI